MYHIMSFVEKENGIPLSECTKLLQARWILVEM